MIRLGIGAAGGAMAMLLAGCGDRTGLNVPQPQSEPPSGVLAPEAMPMSAEASSMMSGEDATVITPKSADGATVIMQGRPEGGSATDGDHREATTDARDARDAASCDYGTVVSDLSGAVVYFAGGARLPAGRYRVTYVDGCMKYSGDQDWSVNAYAPGQGTDTYWLVDDRHNDIVIPPGTIGFLVGSGGFASFDACVAANSQLSPVDFNFAGGELGVWLDDNPYGDNVAGISGRSPTWRLTCDP